MRRWSRERLAALVSGIEDGANGRHVEVAAVTLGW